MRSLLENLLPSASPKPEILRGIFVAVVNGGTLLAKPENWHTLIDLYTNLAASACRVVALFPQATFGAVLTREIVPGRGSVREISRHRSCDTVAAFPASRRWIRAGTFIQALNQTQPGQAAAAESQFYAVLFGVRSEGREESEEKSRANYFSA